MGKLRLMVVVAVAGAALAACSGESSEVAAPGAAVEASARPRAGVDGGALERDLPGADAAAEAAVDAGVPAEDARVLPPVCAAPDVPACDKGPSNDAACSINGPAPATLRYGCRNDIGNGCLPMSNGNGWCCPEPVPPSCVAADPFCVSQGESACGRARGCLGQRLTGCRYFEASGTSCCP